MASSTATLAVDTTVTTECPLQTEVPCFKIKGHGVDLIEGQYLGTGLFSSRGPAVFGANAAPDDGILYLTDSGQLMSALRRQPLSYSQRSSVREQCTFSNNQQSGCGPGCFCDMRAGGGTICVDDRRRGPSCSQDSDCAFDQQCSATIGNQCDTFSSCAITTDELTFWPGEALILNPDGAFSGLAASCQIDCTSLVLTCTGPQGLTQLYVFDPAGQVADKNYVQEYLGWPGGVSDVPFRMMWQTVPSGWSVLPIYLTVEEATCPCRF